MPPRTLLRHAIRSAQTYIRLAMAPLTEDSSHEHVFFHTSQRWKRHGLEGDEKGKDKERRTGKR
eukprot:8326221-Pyramimonas_sp.AAC.1